MARLNIRHATDSDLPRILETLRAALGETPLLRRTPELWAWKHELNPFGPSLVLVAEEDGRIAGVRAMMRWELRTAGGSSFRALRPVDTATHPDFRRRGIFRDLTMAAIDEARADGVDLVFNTPNERSAPGYLNMGWRLVSRIGVLVRPRLGRAITPRPDRPPSLDELAPALFHFDDLALHLHDRMPVGLRTPRSEDYLLWRFASHPTASYGYLPDEGKGVVLARASSRNGLSELVLSDVFDASPTTVRRLARTSRSRYLAGWFSPITPERHLVIRAGMVPVPIRTLQLVALPLTEVGIDIFDLSSWDLATSDLELL